MSRRIQWLLSFAILVIFIRVAHSATPTFVESAPDGKRLLGILDNEIDDPDGKPLLYIHDQEILTDIHAPATLVVDDHDVRHSAAGVKLATFDGENIRHADGQKVIINYHHPDICPDSQSNRIYTVNGAQLTNQQLVAALYILKPDLFKLSDQETADQQKAIEAANAEQEKLDAADQVAGKWTVLNGTGPVDNIGSGFITFGKKLGEVYPVTFDHSKANGPTWSGVAWYKVVSGDKTIWAAYGTPKTVGLCVYEIDGGKLTGKWYPWYNDGDPKNTGTENLQGPDTLDGDYTITSATAPTTGAVYTGSVSIKPLTIVGSADDTKPYSVTWTLGATKIEGIGIKTGKYLFVSAGSGADVNIAKFKIDNGSFNGDFYKLGAKDMGSTAATN
jgi:hypothetical protein